MPLAEGWALQSSAKVKDPGEVIATAAYKAEGWYPITVPSTVVAGLVKNNVYPDPYFGMNIRSYPGMAYPIGKNFSKFPMPADSPFAVPWWYRKQFSIPAGLEGPERLAALRGHQLPGQHLGQRPADRQGQEEAAGALRTYEFNVTARQARRPERGGGAGLDPQGKRPGHHLRRLEPRPRPTSRWACGARCTSAPAARPPCATRR